MPLSEKRRGCSLFFRNDIILLIIVGVYEEEFFLHQCIVKDLRFHSASFYKSLMYLRKQIFSCIVLIIDSFSTGTLTLILYCDN
jgi:hypothetical protein